MATIGPDPDPEVGREGRTVSGLEAISSRSCRVPKPAPPSAWGLSRLDLLAEGVGGTAWRALAPDGRTSVLKRVSSQAAPDALHALAWLRWRDPVYRNLRELAMSYFHEYFNNGRKTLRTYSVAFDLRRFAPETWITGEEDCWDVGAALDDARHYRLIKPARRWTDSIKLYRGVCQAQQAHDLIEYFSHLKKLPQKR